MSGPNVVNNRAVSGNMAEMRGVNAFLERES